MLETPLLGWGLPGAEDPELALAVGRALFVWALDPIVLTEPDDGRIWDANPAACRELGYSVGDLRALAPRGLRDPADARWDSALRARLRTGRFTGELSMARADGTTFPAEVRSAVFSVAGRQYALLVFRDVGDRYRMEQQLRDALAEMARLATVDELTGLLNRRGFLSLGRKQVEIAQRTGTPLFLLAADVDGLKAVNDRYGHAVGDQMLRDVAAVLTETLRRADVLARVGGDEFAAVLTGARAVEEAASAAERVTRALAGYAVAHSRPYRLSLSVGVAGGGESGPLDLEDLMRVADEDLYAAKRRRGGRPTTRRIPAQRRSGTGVTP